MSVMRFVSQIALFLRQKLLRINLGLLQNRPQRAFRHVAGVIRDSCVTASLRVMPDFVAARRLSAENEAEPLQFPDDLPIAVAGKSAHVKRR